MSESLECCGSTQPSIMNQLNSQLLQTDVVGTSVVLK